MDRRRTSVCRIENLEQRTFLHGGGVSEDNFGINAGGGQYIDSTGLTWEADRGFQSSGSAQVVTSNNAIAGTGLDHLFKTTRQDFNMKFETHVPNGQYSVQLLFAEQRLTGAGQRVFSIDIEGSRAASNFDIFKSAGGSNRAVTRTFTATVNDGHLNINFVTGSMRASINAIRVEPASTSPTPTPGGTFKPGTIGWSGRASALFRREEAVSFATGGKLYTIGGYYNAAYDATRRVDVYNVATNSWRRLKDAPTKITHAGVAVDPKTGSVWMTGGFIGDFPAPPATTAVWKYSPSSDSWTKGPPLPVSRGGGGSAIINNKLYFISGSTSGRNSDSAACFALDLANPSAGWKSIASIPGARNHFGSVAVGGKLYAIGGQTGLEGRSVAKSSVYVYDPSTNKWSQTTSMPAANSHFTSTISVYKNRYILTAGGENPHNRALGDVLIFDTVNKKWAKLTSLPDERRAAAGAVFGNKYIVSGGWTYSNQFHSNTWVADLSKLGF